MINKKLASRFGKAGFALGATLLLFLAGCVGYVNGPGAGVYVAPPVVDVGVQDNYVYYPGYNVYFNSTRQQYAYLDGGVWVSRPAPVGVSVDVLLASPSVRMDFHDSPANHNAEMVHDYPRSWASSDSRQMERPEAGRPQAQKPQMQHAQAQKARKPAPKTEKSDEHRN
jgi:hypothetical protein